MDIATILSALQQISSDPKAAEKWVQGFITNMTPQDLAKAVATNSDPIAAAVKEYNLADEKIRPMARVIIRKYWKQITKELRCVPKIIKRLHKNPTNQELLNKPEVIAWLNLHCVRAYNILYLYAWPPNVDLKCAHCGAMFQFDVFLAKEIDFEGQGKRRLYILLCPACGKEVSAVF